MNFCTSPSSSLTNSFINPAISKPLQYSTCPEVSAKRKSHLSPKLNFHFCWFRGQHSLQWFEQDHSHGDSRPPRIGWYSWTAKNLHRGKLSTGPRVESRAESWRCQCHNCHDSWIALIDFYSLEIAPYLKTNIISRSKTAPTISIVWPCTNINVSGHFRGISRTEAEATPFFKGFSVVCGPLNLPTSAHNCQGSHMAGWMNEHEGSDRPQLALELSSKRYRHLDVDIGYLM